MRKRILALFFCFAFILGSCPLSAVSAGYTDPNEWLWSDAYYDEEEECFILTEDKTWTAGSIWYNTPYTKDFTLEMDYYTGVPDRPLGGADGITVAFYADYNYTMGNGRQMGFYGSKGYGVELDTYYNWDYHDPDYKNVGREDYYETDYNHIGLVREVGSNHLITEKLPESEDGSWHHLKIELKNYVCSAYVDGKLKFSYQVEETGYGWIGITSATGRGNNLHAVKNISITGETPPADENLISVSLAQEKLAGPTEEDPERRYEYMITATIRNGMSVTARDVDAVFHPGELLDLAEGSSATVNLGDIQTDGVGTAQWKVYADAPQESIAADFDVLTIVDDQIRLLKSDYIYLDASNFNDHAVQFGTDQWGFNNSCSYFGPDGEPYYLENVDYQALLSGLSNITRERVEDYKNSDWNGSCYGMSVTVVLTKMGILNPGDLPNGRDTLYEIPKSNNDRVESMINFYHMQQRTELSASARSIFLHLETEEQLAKIEEMAEEVAEGGYPFLLAVSNDSGGHAVVCYGVERGDYKVGDFLGIGQEEYDSRLLLYNCSQPMASINEPDYLYFNAGTDQWHFSDYTKLVMATDDPQILDIKNYGAEVQNYVAQLLLERDTAAYLEYEDTTYRIDGNTDQRQAGIVSYYEAGAYLNEKGDLTFGGDLYCTLPDPAAEYELSPAEGDPIGYTLTYPNTAITAKAREARSVRFSSDGTLRVENAGGDYLYSLCYNEGHHVLPWYQFTIEGTDSGDFQMEQTEKGIRISAEHLEGAIITVDDGEKEQTLPISSKGTDILVVNKTVDGKEIPVILVDSDNDGEFGEEQPDGAWEFTVLLDANGGTVSPEAMTTVEGKVKNLPVPERPGYQFEGWYTDDGEKVTDSMKFTQNATLYAHWTVLEADDEAPPAISVAGGGIEREWTASGDGIIALHSTAGEKENPKTGGPV